MKKVIFIGVRYAHAGICLAPDDSAPVTLGDKLLVLATSLEGRSKDEIYEIDQTFATTCQCTNDFRGKACTVIIVNWSADIVDLLETFNKYMAPGSSIHILAAVEVREREQRLQKHQLQNIKILHHQGQVNEVESIQELPLNEAAAILVLGSGTSDSSNADWNDARVLSCGITISDRLRSSGLTSRLICEVLSSRVHRMLRRDEPLRERATFFHSNSLETGLVATASANRAVYNTLLMLMDPTSGNSIRAVPANAHCWGERSTTFQVLGERLRLQGHILLGFLGSGTACRLILNPEDSEVQVQPSDQLVVIWRDSSVQKVVRAAPYAMDGYEAASSADSDVTQESTAAARGCFRS